MRSFDSNVAISVNYHFNSYSLARERKFRSCLKQRSTNWRDLLLTQARIELFLQHLLSVSYQVLQKQREFLYSALHFIGTPRIPVRFDYLLLLALLHLGEDGPLKLQLLLHEPRRGDLLFEQVTPDHEYKLNMEQNQRQPTPQVAPQEQQWNATRNQFANEGEAIGQSEDVAALVQKWVWIQHEEQFKKYERQLQEHEEGSHTLQSLIGELIQWQKEESWMINQRYTMEQVNHIIEKLRERVKQVLKSGNNLNPEAQISVNQAQEKQNSKNAIQTQLQKGNEKEVQVNNSSIFPQIKPKGRLLNPKEMHSSFHLLKQTEEQYKIQSPSMFALDKKTKDVHRQGIFNNKYLRQAFKWLSKQGYNYKGLFQDFSKEGDRMNLNKWMVFCKEFDFTQKLPKKDLVSIFQTATKFSSTMFIEDFLTAVALLQDKYVSRYHKGQQNFVAEVLQINNQASFKVKMDNLKVNYSGPRKNFFQQGTYPQHEREEQMQRQKQFQIKKREREIVLIKGMFQEHLKDEVKQLKANRQKMKVNRLGSSLNMIEIKQKSKEKEAPYKTARLQELNYSKLFHLNRGIANESNTTTANTRMYNTQLAKTDIKPHKIEHKRIDADNNKKNESEHKRIEAKAAQTHRNQLPQKTNFNVHKQKPVPIIQETPPERTWLTNVRSDSQQSDDILKEHLQFEKKVKQTKVQKLMKQMKERSRQVDKIHEQLKRQEKQQIDGDMVQTQVNFNKIAV